MQMGREWTLGPGRTGMLPCTKSISVIEAGVEDLAAE